MDPKDFMQESIITFTRSTWNFRAERHPIKHVNQAAFESASDKVVLFAKRRESSGTGSFPHVVTHISLSLTQGPVWDLINELYLNPELKCQIKCPNTWNLGILTKKHQMWYWSTY